MIELWENESRAARCVTTDRPLTHTRSRRGGLAMQAIRSCSIPDCVRPVHARTWCKTHHMRYLRNGDPLGSKPRRQTGPCSIPECPRPHLAGGFCGTHWRRWRRHGDPHRVDVSPVRLTGENNLRWLGDDASYIGVHDRLRRALGKASDHACADCGQQAADWSYDHGDADARTHDGLSFSLKPEHYQPRCRSCHWSIDNPAGWTPPPRWRNVP